MTLSRLSNLHSGFLFSVLLLLIYEQSPSYVAMRIAIAACYCMCVCVCVCVSGACMCCYATGYVCFLNAAAATVNYSNLFLLINSGFWPNDAFLPELLTYAEESLSCSVSNHHLNSRERHRFSE